MTAMYRIPRAVVGLAAAVVAFALLAACSATSTTNSVAGPKPTLAASQDGTTTDSTVYDPFYLLGANYPANATVSLAIYRNGTKTDPVFSKDVTIPATGQLKVTVDTVPAGEFDAYTTLKGAEQAQAEFKGLGTRTKSVTRVVTQSLAGAFASPVTSGGDLLVAQSKSGGGIFRWSLSDLPKTPPSARVTIDPTSVSVPEMSPNAKMEQISIGNDKKTLFISKKAIDGRQPGGNSVWTYPWQGSATTGTGTNLAGLSSLGGDGSQAWPGNNAQAAIDYTYAPAHFPKPSGSTTPTASAIGNGGGVAQAGNGYLYFGSLQSGCVYKQNIATSQTWAIYCIPSWGSGNQNQSIYSLDNDKSGNIYAMYQGSTDNNTIILKIVPGGAGQTSDTIQALQLTGYARSVGLAVNADGTRIFADGVSMSQYDTNNTNAILEIDNPVWGTPEKPSGNTPIATTIPGAYNETWLTGMTLVDKGGNKGDRLFVADNVSGFWIMYL